MVNKDKIGLELDKEAQIELRNDDEDVIAPINMDALRKKVNESYFFRGIYRGLIIFLGVLLLVFGFGFGKLSVCNQVGGFLDSSLNCHLNYTPEVIHYGGVYPPLDIPKRDASTPNLVINTRTDHTGGV